MRLVEGKGLQSCCIVPNRQPAFGMAFWQDSTGPNPIAEQSLKQGVAAHFDAPSDVREFLAHLLDDERERAVAKSMRTPQ